jgi:hypothetical protein
MTKAEEIFKNMREKMPWSIIGEKQLKPYILEAMQEYGKYCAEKAWIERPHYDNTLLDFYDFWSEFQRKEATK